MNRYITIVIGAGIIVAACSTPYQSYGFTGGVGSQQLNKLLYKIDAQGNGYTSRGRIKDYTMLKASEICREKGFSSFDIVTGQNHTSRSYASTPAHTNCYGGSCSTYGGGLVAINKPSSSITVYFYSSSDEVPLTATDCDLIYRQLAQVYIKK